MERILLDSLWEIRFEVDDIWYIFQRNYKVWQVRECERRRAYQGDQGDDILFLSLFYAVQQPCVYWRFEINLSRYWYKAFFYSFSGIHRDAKAGKTKCLNTTIHNNAYLLYACKISKGGSLICLFYCPWSSYVFYMEKTCGLLSNC